MAQTQPHPTPRLSPHTTPHTMPHAHASTSNPAAARAALCLLAACAGLFAAPQTSLAQTQPVAQPPAATPPQKQQPAATKPETTKPGATAQPATASPLAPFERGGGDPIDPRRAGTTQLEDATLKAADGSPLTVPQGIAYPEGTYLPRVLGRLILTDRGEVILAPNEQQHEQDEARTALLDRVPAMVLLPNTRREQIIASMEQQPGATYAVGGQVYNYHARTYLLTSTFVIASTPTTNTNRAAQPNPSTNAAAPTDSQQVAARPDVADLIRQLEAAASAQRTLLPGGAPRVPDPQEAPATRAAQQDQGVIAAFTDGSLLRQQRGRIVRLLGDGARLAFSIDNDTDSPAAAPLQILPCEVLEELEAVSAAHSDTLVLRMTGRVVAGAQGGAGAKSYLLPIHFQVVRQADITPGQ